VHQKMGAHIEKRYPICQPKFLKSPAGWVARHKEVSQQNQQVTGNRRTKRE